MESLIKVLLSASEKSANIARAWIAQNELFSLLVEEKQGEAKNQRFVADFKTLADVIVQEVVKHDVSRKFPELKGQILGEESNVFTNTHGITITVEIQESAAATANLLSEVLDNNCAAQILADIIHDDVTVAVEGFDGQSDCGLDMGELGIWIDPIDGTAEFMSRSDGVYKDGLLSQGLPCVTVLIGVFNYKTGNAIAGVVNQPFVKYNQETETWTGLKTWGFAIPGFNLTSVKSTEMDCANNNNVKSNVEGARIEHPSVVISASECDSVIKKFTSADISCYAVSTVGYKLLKVIDGTVNAYILSKGSSFKWDTCAAHAILQSLGGGVVSFEHAVKIVSENDSINHGDSSIIEKLKKIQLCYHKPDGEKFELGKKWSNSGGLVAFRRYEDLLEIIRAVAN